MSKCLEGRHQVHVRLFNLHLHDFPVAVFPRREPRHRYFSQSDLRGFHGAEHYPCAGETGGRLLRRGLQLRRRGASVLLVHHAGRGDHARGTSKREDVLDTVIQLKTPDDYTPEDGARFEVHLTKARGVFGDDAAPFEARLRVDEGVAIWSVADLKDVEADRIAELTRDGMTTRDIGDKMGIGKSKVNRIQMKLRKDGQLDP